MDAGCDVAKKTPPASLLVCWAILIVAGVCWGIVGPLAKLAVSTGNHPVGISFWGSLIGSVFLTLVLLARKQRIPMDGASVLFFFVCGLLGTAIPNVLSYAAYEFVSVGVAAIIFSMSPIITLALAIPLGMEKFNVARILGLLLGVVAVLLIMLPKSSLPDRDQVFWVLVLLVAVLSYSLEIIYISAKRPKDFDTLTIVCGLSWASLVLLLPALFLDTMWVDITRWEAPEQAIVANAFLNLVSYFGYVWLVTAAGPVFASQINYVITGSGVVLGMIIYNELHSLWVWVALALMCAGLALVTPREKK